jgi:eukaryotic-like serine/threonine-protein kinase
MAHTKPLGGASACGATELEAGTTVGEYVLLRQLAAGGFGTVFLAEHQVLGRRAAVKILHRELAGMSDVVERFVREARAVTLIGHPSIVDVFALAYLPDGRPYYVMEYVDGPNLEHVLRERGPLTPAEALDLLEPVCDALEAAHAAGVIHRDVKASNVLVAHSGRRNSVRLCDFGVAQILGSDEAACGLATVDDQLGSPVSMAPEQFRGQQVDPRTDVYGLGVLLYHLLTGRPPFVADTVAELERMHLGARPPRASRSAQVPRALDLVVLRCLEKQPERRYGSVAELRTALRRACGAVPVRLAVPDLVVAAAFLHIEALVEGDELDDGLVADLDVVFDTAVARLREAGMSIALDTGMAALGVLLLSAHEAEQEWQRERALVEAAALYQALVSRPAPDPRVRVCVTLHEDRASVRFHPGGPEIVGGAEGVTVWAPRDGRSGVYATAAAVRGLPGLDDGSAFVDLEAFVDTYDDDAW